MNISLNRSISVIAIVLMFNIICYSAESPFPVNSISSCFGPRIHPIEKTSEFHPGIDYAQPKSTPIKPADGGIIDKILWENKAGWVVGVQSLSGYWSYLHTFEGKTGDLSKPIEVGSFVLGKDKEGVYILRKATNLWSKKVFRPQKSEVEVEFEVIAPVGDSTNQSNMKPHLHLNLNRRDDNPLSQFADILSDFKVEMLNPKDGSEVSSKDLKNDYDIRFKIDTTKGTDLDRVIVYLDNKEVVCQDNKEKGEFNYGGLPGAEKKNMDISNGSTTGVKPIRQFTNEFVLLTDFTGLSEGEHVILIKAIDVKENMFENRFKFTLKKTNTVNQISGELIYRTGLGEELEIEKYSIHITSITKTNIVKDKDGNLIIDSNGDYSIECRVNCSMSNSLSGTSLGTEHIKYYTPNQFECRMFVVISKRKPDMPGSEQMFQNFNWGLGDCYATVWLDSGPDITSVEKIIEDGMVMLDVSEKYGGIPGYSNLPFHVILNKNMLQLSQSGGQMGGFYALLTGFIGGGIIEID